MAGYRLAPRAALSRRNPWQRSRRAYIPSVTAPVVTTGVGDTLSEGVGAAGTPQFWDFDYVSVIVSVTGAGDTLSAGVGTAGTPTYWPFDYWDGVSLSTGAGDNLSQGIGAVTALGPAEWYSITGTVLLASSAAGSGDTLSEGVGTVGVYDTHVAVTGAGDTLSEGVAVNPLPTVVPPGGIRLSPYWAPGEIVYAYTLHEWLGSYEARLGAGPGPIAQIAYGDVDTTVAFGGLEPGQYVAVAGPKRVHFMVTE